MVEENIIRAGRGLVKPKKCDMVERTDMSRMFGEVIKLLPPNKVRVKWHDDLKPEETDEELKDLALVCR